MTLKEAVKEISKKQTIIGQIAELSIKEDNYIDFANMIKKQYNQWNGATLVAAHGFDIINTILKN